LNKESSLACHVLSRSGLPLARKLAKGLAARPWPAPFGRSVRRCVISAPARFAEDGVQPFLRLGDFLAREYRGYAGHVFVGAAGIAVRALAPLLTHKSADPPVLVLDAAGRFVISLLSGHWGGGNALARHVAGLLAATTVITTASDAAQRGEKNCPAIDLLARDAGLRILDWDTLPKAQAALLEGRSLRLWDPCFALPLAAPPHFERLPGGETDPPADSGAVFPTVTAHWRFIPPGPGILRLAVPGLCVGIGCRKNLEPEEVPTAIEELFSEHGLELRAVAALATVTEKKEDASIRRAMEKLNVPLYDFSANALSRCPAPHPSTAAGKRFACPPFSVCEAAALRCAGRLGAPARLLLPKRVIRRRVTLAVALASSASDNGGQA
jgi:cobalt-precorrin 5A hydrolase